MGTSLPAQLAQHKAIVTTLLRLVEQEVPQQRLF